MAETSLPWGGTATGDAGAYSDDNWSDAWGSLFTYDRTVQGVVNTARVGYTGLLEVTNPSTSVIRVASGIALVDGKIYYNTANIDETLDVPLTGTNYFTVVLKKDFAAQTVRVDIKEAAGNSDGGASTAVGVPVVTQTDGTTWEISLATVTTAVGPVVTITDTRTYILDRDDSISTDQIQDEAVTAAKIDNRTRAFLVQSPTAYDMNGAATIDRAGWATYAYNIGAAGWPLGNAVDTRVFGNFYVPSDFASGMTITMIVSHSDFSGAEGGATSDGVFRMYSYYGAVDQAGDTHSEDTGATTVALHKPSLIEDVLVDTLTDVAAGDYVSIEASREGDAVADTCDSTYFNFVGFLVSYTADS